MGYLPMQEECTAAAVDYVYAYMSRTAVPYVVIVIVVSNGRMESRLCFFANVDVFPSN